MDSWRFTALSNITFLPKKYRRLFSYVIVGGISAVVDLSVFFSSVYLLSIDFFIAGGMSFILATFVNFYLCRKFLFTDARHYTQHQQLVGVYLVSGIGLLVHQAILYSGVELLGIHLIITKLCASGSVFLWNYLGRVHLVFR